MLKVIVVEDAALLRKGLIMTTSWEQNGCEVIGEATNGLEGRDMILRLKPNIVITDIRLPGMSGLEMIEAVRGKVGAKFIIISGYSEFDYAQKALSLNVTDYLVKPIGDRALSDALARAGNAVWADSVMERIQDGMDGVQHSPFMMFQERLLYGTAGGDYVERAAGFIREHYAEDISVSDVADKLGISESHLSRIFRAETTYTVMEYLTYCRIKQACRLLTDPDARIYEVADKVGYGDQRYFSVVFKKMVGMTPKEFQRYGRLK